LYSGAEWTTESALVRHSNLSIIRYVNAIRISFGLVLDPQANRFRDAKREDGV